MLTHHEWKVTEIHSSWSANNESLHQYLLWIYQFSHALSSPVYVNCHKNHEIPRSTPTLRSKGLYISNPAPFSTFLQLLNLSCPLKFMVHQNCLSTFFPPGCPHQLLATTEMWIAPESSFSCSLFKCCFSSLTPPAATGPKGLGSISLFFSASFRSLPSLQNL